ncbi:MAG: AI-2E family transporter [Candidatus Doudnabacteria bacterium]
MEDNRVQSNFFIALFVGVLILNIWVFKPFFSLLIFALTLAVLFKPIYQRIRKYAKNDTIAALVTTTLVFLLIILPLSFYIQQVVIEVHYLYNSLTGESSNTFVNVITQKINGLNNTALSYNINQYLKNLSNLLLQNIGEVFSSIARLIFTSILVVFSLFFLLKDGEKLKNGLYALSPFPRDADDKLINKMEAAINSVIRGQMLVAVLQGFFATLGFTLFGVPNPLLLGTTVILAAFVPTVGTALINIPVILYLYFSGQAFAALGLLIWELVAVTIIDNFIGPIVINKSLKFHPFIILLSIIGGISAFGPIGFILGPLILTLLTALFEIRYLLIEK